MCGEHIGELFALCSPPEQISHLNLLLFYEPEKNGRVHHYRNRILHNLLQNVSIRSTKVSRWEEEQEENFNVLTVKMTFKTPNDCS
jgi:hypothetical protein